MELLHEGRVQPLRVFEASQAEEAVKCVKNSEMADECVVICPKDQDVVSVSNFVYEFCLRSISNALLTAYSSLRQQYLVTEERHWKFDHQASYLVAGGSGGLGRAIVRWMADRGAKHIIMASRSGATSDAARELIAELEERDVNVVALQCDVSSESSLAGVLEERTRRDMPPIRGCMNAAMVLQDAIFQESMTFAQWDLTMRSKVQSSYNLHRLLPQDLDFFVLLSSLAGVVGQMGSANYAAGCSFQNALVRHRLSHGQRALSLDIGWMKDIGIIAETSAYQRQRQRLEDMQPIDASELLAVLTLALDPVTPLPTPVPPSRASFSSGSGRRPICSPADVPCLPCWNTRCLPPFRITQPVLKRICLLMLRPAWRTRAHFSGRRCPARASAP
jgi:NAD(P)-dependent dehydrogenase (short-subunit alcohol dehydrogenase family)